MNEIPGDVLSKMGVTEIWTPTTDIEIVWNDRVLCVVDRQTKRVVVMVMSWMTELEVSIRNGYGERSGGKESCHS